MEEREKVKRTEKEPHVVTLDVWGSFEKLCNRFDGKERCAKVRPWLSKLEKRLASLTRHQLTILVVAIGLFFLLLGVGLGVLLAFSRPPSPSDTNQDNSSSTPEIIFETGVLRMLQVSQDGIDFYLEKQDKTQVLLKTTEKINPALLTSFKDLVVTIEGKLIKGDESSKDILQIEKIWIKR